MAVIFHNSLCFPPPPRFRRTSAPPSSRITPFACVMDHQRVDDLRRKFMEFPYISPTRRHLMTDLLSAVENRLGSQLLTSCALPPDAQYFKNESGTAHASLNIRSGRESSLIDFILGSWIHFALPTGESLNITSISAYLKSSTDAPNFVLELIQSSPTSLVLILDLPHRKDLILHPDYLQTFYENTQLDSHRQALAKLPEVKPYVSPSLFVRCAFSPAAVMIQVDAEADRVEEIVRDHIGPAAKEVLKVWLDKCANGERGVVENEKVELEKRDRCFRRKTIEVDLASSFPRMFGDEVANRVLDAMRVAFGV